MFYAFFFQYSIRYGIDLGCPYAELFIQYLIGSVLFEADVLHVLFSI